MTDRYDDVLRHIDQTIDGADDDWTVSGDAMRWTPETPREYPKRPVDRFTMTVPHRNGEHTADAMAANLQSWSVTVPFTVTETNQEAVDALFGLDADDPRREIQAGIDRMHQDLADRLGCSVAEIRSFTEYLGHQISAASDWTPEEAEEQLLRFVEASNPPDPPTAEEIRRRALEARRNRNTGPTRHDNRRWRNT